jgi:hypothetical protein
MEDDLGLRLHRIERRARFLTGLLVVLVGWTVLTVVRREVTSHAQSIRVSEIVVVDNNGVERVRIGGSLPDPVINGRSAPRGGKLAGILLYDGDGIERSGYGTFSPEANVVLTFDGKQGQRALFVATPQGDSALKMWRGNDWIEFRVDEAGARLNTVRERELVARVPTASEADNTALCSEYQALRSRVSAPQLIAACRERMADVDCGACLK